MSTDDTRVAALAAAVFDAHAEYPYLDVGDRELAAFLLRALKGWELVPTGSADWDNGYDEGRKDQAAEFARLRKIEDAAREAWRCGWFTTNEAGDRAAVALHAALEEKL